MKPTTLATRPSATTRAKAKRYTTAEAMPLAVGDGYTFVAPGGFSFSFRANKVLLRGPGGVVRRDVSRFLDTYRDHRWTMA